MTKNRHSPASSQPQGNALYGMEDCWGPFTIGPPCLDGGKVQVLRKNMVSCVEVIFAADNGAFGCLTCSALREDAPKGDLGLEGLIRFDQCRWAGWDNVLLNVLEPPLGRVYERIVFNTKEQPGDHGIPHHRLHLDWNRATWTAVSISHYLVRCSRVFTFHLYCPNWDKRTRLELIQDARSRCSAWRATLRVEEPDWQALNQRACWANLARCDTVDVLDARKMIMEFMPYVHQHDWVGARDFVVCDHRLDEFMAVDWPRGEPYRQFQWDTNHVYPELTPDYQPYVAGTSGPLPEGSLLRFEDYDGPLIWTVKKQHGQWRVDLRWWLASLDRQRGRVSSAPERDYAVWAMFSALLRQRPGELRRFLSKGSDASALFPPGDAVFSKRRGLQGYLEILSEMPLVEPAPDDFVLADTGGVARIREIAQGAKVLVGLFGRRELVFWLDWDGGSWRVRPRKYLHQLGFQNGPEPGA